MMGRNTRLSNTRLWTGISTLLLLVSGSATSQGGTTLRSPALSLHAESVTESSSGSVASLGNIDSIGKVPSAALKNVDVLPEVSIEGDIDEELPDILKINRNGTQKTESLSDSKSEKLIIQEPLTKVASIEEKRFIGGSLPEFRENEDNSEIEDLEDEDDREPTTPPPKKEFSKTDAPKDSKRKDPKGEREKEKIPEIGISLINDTNVNYNDKKHVKDTKDERVFGNDSNSRKGILENTTNGISSGADAADDQEKGKGPKTQVEVVKNSTLPKVMRISDVRPTEERKEVDNLGSAKQESVVETIESTISPESKNLMGAREKANNLTLVNGGNIEGEKSDDRKILESPKGRTISFGGTNEFIATDNKTEGPIRDNDRITDRPSNQMITDYSVTKEPIREQKSADFKPYPYVKTNYESNSSEVLLTGNGQLPESTEEAAALENTIGQRQQDEKFIVTEPSVVIDNSIQHFKPTYYKRSGNSTRIPSSSGITMPTVSSLEGEEKSATTLSSKSITLENDTALFVSRLPVSNTENDVPRGKDEAAKSSEGFKDTTSSLDLTGNGITEVIAAIKNDSVAKDSPTRATEKILVQNSTEKIATTNDEVTLTNGDTQTDPAGLSINISSFNATEQSSRIASNQNDSNILNSKPTLLMTTLMPEISSEARSTPENLSMSTSAPFKTSSTSTLMPESSFKSTPNTQSSLTSTLITETSTIPTMTSNISTFLNPTAHSGSTLIPTMTSMLSKVTFASMLSTELENQTNFDSDKSADAIHQTTLKTVESFGLDEPVESTTSKIEYVFVGLTESTSPQDYIATSESSNSMMLDTEFASPTPSSVIGSSTSSRTSTVLSPTLGILNNDTELSTTTIKPEQTSLDPGTLIVKNDTSDDPTTITSSVEMTTIEDSTISKHEDTVESTTTDEDSSTTLTNESAEITTEEVTESTNSTNLSAIIPDHNENTTETGRAVDSFTSIPDVTGTMIKNSSETIISFTEASNISITSGLAEFSEPPQIPNKNVTSESPRVSSTSERSSIDVEFNNSSSQSTYRKSSTKPNTSSAMPDVNTTTSGDATEIGTDDSIEITSRGVPSLVKVVFEGSWADVCPHLDVLRQSLADLLTAGLEKTVLASQIIFQNNPCTEGFAASSMTTESPITALLLYVVDEKGNFDSEMTKTLPSLYSKSPIKLQVNIRSFQLVQDSDSGNAIAVIVVSCVALICLVVLAGLLFIMRKRQTRFNYGERCRPVSLDAYSLDSVSAYNSVRRKGAARASKRSYGNPTFEDSSAIPSHPLNFAGLSTFCNEQNAISEEFAGIPQVTARIDELPQGAEVKNRYANVVPLPETRVSLIKINNDPLTEYINASYVRGPKNATKYYIACQAPIESTVTDFWRMIWEQQSKVVIMLTDLVENGVEKCAEYIPPSEVTDCHRLFGDFQVTLKKRETKEKYAISTLHLKNLENNTFREISHIWYLWPANGVQSDAAGLIAVLLEARALQRGGPGPIVVHCSPGTGRTGTLIALDLGIRQYEITRTVDVPRVVYTIRRDRAGAVQTKEQYAFIYKALNLYATKLAGGALES